MILKITQHLLQTQSLIVSDYVIYILFLFIFVKFFLL